MTDAVCVRTFPAPEVDRREILRYAGGGCPEELLDQCLESALPVLQYRACWRRFPLSIDGGTLDLGFARTQSAALRRNLTDCTEIIVFAATAGLGIDRLILRHKALSPARALVLQAIGAERIEALCDTLNRALAEEQSRRGCYTRPRFSPGYGDLPLSLQPALLSALDSWRKIGVSLNESLLMTPSKSVTAVIGLSRTPGPACKRGCASCGNKGCAFRRESGE